MYKWPRRNPAAHNTKETATIIASSWRGSAEIATRANTWNVIALRNSTCLAQAAGVYDHHDHYTKRNTLYKQRAMVDGMYAGK
jgi:hypothetical protein